MDVIEELNFLEKNTKKKFLGGGGGGGWGWVGVGGVGGGSGWM